jgi:hypothetical protein
MNMSQLLERVKEFLEVGREVGCEVVCEVGEVCRGEFCSACVSRGWPCYA